MKDHETIQECPDCGYEDVPGWCGDHPDCPTCLVCGFCDVCAVI